MCRVVTDEMLMESMEMVVEDAEEPEDEDVGVLHLSPEGPVAALQSQQRPALLAGTEVGRLPPAEPMDQAAGSSGASGAGQQGQYAGPLALVALNKELVPHPQQPGECGGVGGVRSDASSRVVVKLKLRRMVTARFIL